MDPKGSVNLHPLLLSPLAKHSVPRRALCRISGIGFLSGIRTFCFPIYDDRHGFRFIGTPIRCPVLCVVYKRYSELVPATGETFSPRVCSVGYTIPVPGVFWCAYRSFRSVGYRYCGHTELDEVSGTGIECVPNYTGLYVRLLRPYRITSVG